MADLQNVGVPIDVLVGAIAIVQVLVQAVAQAVSALIARSKEGRESPGDVVLRRILETIEERNEGIKEESFMIREMYEQHKVTDKDGRPVWYFPGSVVDVLQKISESQRETALILGQLERRGGR